MEKSPSWEANQFSAGQEIPCILLLRSPVPTTCPYSEPAPPSPYSHILFPEDPS